MTIAFKKKLLSPICLYVHGYVATIMLLLCHSLVRFYPY